MSIVTRRTCPVWVPVVVLVLTVAQLAVAEWWPGIERFADKAFGARLVAYPLLMLLAPAIWWLVVRRRERDAAPPYGAFTLVMLPFLIDVTGNSLDLYDSVVWWDDFNHWINWLLLLTGIGLLVAGNVRPDWALVVSSRGSARSWPSAGSWGSGGPSSDTAPSSTRRTRTRSATSRSAPSARSAPGSSYSGPDDVVSRWR